MLTQTLSTELELHLDDRTRLSNMAKEVKKQLDAVNQTIKDKMIAGGAEQMPNGDLELVIGDRRLVLAMQDGRRTLDKGELIALGVGTDLIEQATKTGEPFLKLDVRKVGEAA